jgi:hypothetical protein
VSSWRWQGWSGSADTMRCVNGWHPVV